MDYCITWARLKFEDLLEKTLAEANAFLMKPKEYKMAMKLADMKGICRFWVKINSIQWS